MSKHIDLVNIMAMFQIITLVIVFAMAATEKDGQDEEMVKPKPKEWYKKWVENDEVPYVQSVRELGKYQICYQICLQMIGR